MNTRKVTTRMASALGALTFGIVAMPVVYAQGNSYLIVPGRSIGQTRIGPDGDRYLNRLPSPTTSDAGMMQQRMTWTRRHPDGRVYTLYIHTVANGVYDDVNPKDGVTIDEIRVTSPIYHTAIGIHVGSTLARILRAYPGTRAEADNPFTYEDTAQGIAFRFSGTPSGVTPCTAIEVDKVKAGRPNS